MKIVSMLFALTLLGLNQAQASGCGSYTDSREILKQEVIKELTATEKYRVESMDSTKAVVSIPGSDKKITLDWVSSSHSDRDVAIVQFQEKDLFVQEGNACGPVYRCITGQIILTHYDRNTLTTTTYAYPRFVPAARERLSYYVTDSPLLPLFGSNIKLDVPAIGKNHINGEQCGYGSW